MIYTHLFQHGAVSWTSVALLFLGMHSEQLTFSVPNFRGQVSHPYKYVDGYGCDKP
jgi:hypothetical protein